MTVDTQRTKILCVDDEPLVLEGIARHLRRRYEVLAATGGPAALELLRQDGDVAVIVSDMRMPGMDGATFLAHARQVVPNAVRILLTGDADLSAAIAAVNQGQIFRFLTKPCAPTALIFALAAATQQHRLITAEHVLLEQTLHGSVKALTDVLALANPTAFGRASRIKDLVSALARGIGMAERWQCELAAMLSQLGTITLSSETVEKLFHAQPLTAAERELVDRIPAETERILGSIPRLEVVRGILATYLTTRHAATVGHGDPESDLVGMGARLLRVAVDFDTLERHGNAPREAIAHLRKQPDHYNHKILTALEAVCSVRSQPEAVFEVHLSALEAGMTLAEDVRLRTGALLAARGYTVTTSFISRVRNLGYAVAKDTLRVTAQQDGHVEES
jgi:response regulator RpfG family c-di-GMP phosphodiesterase